MDMELYKRNSSLVNVVRWCMNGDHPNDACETFIGSDGKPFQGEGKIVRYYRHPFVDGQSQCPHCAFIMHWHGWIDVSPNGRVVCPGDYIVNEEGTYYPVKPDIFEATHTGLSDPHEEFSLKYDKVSARMREAARVVYCTATEEKMGEYDSTEDTCKHIKDVQNLMGIVIENLKERARVHDASKLAPPEKEMFDKYTPMLKGCTYGSEEYKRFLVKLKPALDHHYSVNSHHPECSKNGIKGMTLLDIVEMLCDWRAAALRHADGDIWKSIEINQKRFGYSDELKEIFKNTLVEIGITPAPDPAKTTSADAPFGA